MRGTRESNACKDDTGEERRPPAGSRRYCGNSPFSGKVPPTTMRVAFIKPPVGGILGLEMLTFVEPLGPICVAACLEQDGHECKVLDLRIDGEEKGLAECVAFGPDIVGLQCNF